VSHWRCSRLQFPPTQWSQTLISPVIRRSDGKLPEALLSRPTCFTPLPLMPLAIFQRFLIYTLWFPFKSPLADCAVLRYLLLIISFIMEISLLIYVLFCTRGVRKWLRQGLRFQQITNYENWTFLGYYTACSGNSLPTFRNKLSGPIFMCQESKKSRKKLWNRANYHRIVYR